MDFNFNIPVCAVVEFLKINIKFEKQAAYTTLWVSTELETANTLKCNSKVTIGSNICLKHYRKTYTLNIQTHF